MELRHRALGALRVRVISLGYILGLLIFLGIILDWFHGIDTFGDSLGQIVHSFHSDGTDPQDHPHSSTVD